MSNYSIKKESGYYVIFSDNTILKTPGGNDIKTQSKCVADRIVNDLTIYGYDYHSVSSILSWHFTLLDNFSRMTKDTVINFITSSFPIEKDWTCEPGYISYYKNYSDTWKVPMAEISRWMENANYMQLTALCCIGNAYESLLISYHLAKIMENCPAGESRDNEFKRLAYYVAITYGFTTEESVFDDFKTFELYCEPQIDENGLTSDRSVETIDNVDTCNGKMNAKGLNNHKVTIEQLVGRNYYHYTNGTKDKEQPAAYCITDFKNLDTCKDVEKCIEYNLPSDCWIKRFADDEDYNKWYIFYLVVDDEGNINSSGCIEETSYAADELSFMLPGLEISDEKRYKDNPNTPQKALDDLQLLLAGRSLPLDFSFADKQVPQRLIDECIENDDIDDEGDPICYLLSAHRSSYLSFHIITHNDSLIKRMEYDTRPHNQSLFSRPSYLSDIREDAIDILLYIYDKYTDEELAKL